MDKKRIIALGFFDGVHLGHQMLLRACREMAEQSGAVAAALTFDTHPETLVKGAMPGLLNTVVDREKLLRAYGMEDVIILAFNEQLRRMDWMDFFRMLRDEYGAVGLVCGHDFRFGYRGQGNAQKLEMLCAEQGLLCRVIPEQRLEERTVSSTLIRQRIEDGQIGQANRFLGHPYFMSGQVVTGRRLGHTLGFPTANILIPERIICPKHGVYLCYAQVDGVLYQTLTNVGSRPTVEGHQIRTESWLMDFSGDLYGKNVTLYFCDFLRPERRFESLQELKDQILQDEVQAKRFFAEKSDFCESFSLQVEKLML